MVVRRMGKQTEMRRVNYSLQKLTRVNGVHYREATESRSMFFPEGLSLDIDMILTVKFLFCKRNQVLWTHDCLQKSSTSDTDRVMVLIEVFWKQPRSEGTIPNIIVYSSINKGSKESHLQS